MDAQRPDTAVYEGFGQDLVEAIQPIRHYVLATVLHDLFESKIFEEMLGGDVSVKDYCTNCEIEEGRFTGMMRFLQNEGIVYIHDGLLGLTSKGRALEPFIPWYTMLIGGYGETFASLSQALPLGSVECSRNLHLVGVGSCGISEFDAIPLTKALMSDAETRLNRMLDLGCGNAQYIATFCIDDPSLTAFGIEPSEDGYLAAKVLIEELRLERRVTLKNITAQQYMEEPDADFEPDLLVLGFVLHEILGQDGVEGVERFLNRVFAVFPDIHLIVIEVQNIFDQPGKMDGGLELAYYNAYYLLHSFTSQRLINDSDWQEIFSRLNIEIVSKRTTDENVDSTGLEIGYLLRKR